MNPSTPSNLYDYAELCRELWCQTIATLAACSRDMEAINHAWHDDPRSLGEANRHMQFIRNPIDPSDHLPSIRSTVIGTLVDLASRSFGIPGVPLEIESRDVTEALERQDIARFDPVAVWSWLVDRYAGEKGVAIAHRQIADTLRKQLYPEWRRDRSPATTRKGGTVFDIRMWIESYCIRSDGSLDYSYDSRGRLDAFLNRGLVAFWKAERGSDTATIRELVNYSERIPDSGTGGVDGTRRKRH